MLPTTDGAIWTLSNGALGLLVRLHRAVEAEGDRDAGRLNLEQLDALVGDDREAIEELEARGFVCVVEVDRVIVNTWARAQGEVEAREREVDRERKTRARSTGDEGVGGLSGRTGSQGSDNTGNRGSLCKTRNTSLSDRTTSEDSEIIEGRGSVCNGAYSGGKSLSTPLVLPPSHSPPLTPPAVASWIPDPDRTRAGAGVGEQARMILDPADAELASVVAEWRTLEPFDKIRDLEDLARRTRRLFPRLDLRVEARAVDFWWGNNPERRKEYRNLRRFVGGWFKRAAEDLEARAGKQAATAAAGDRKRTAEDKAVDAIWGRR